MLFHLFIWRKGTEIGSRMVSLMVRIPWFLMRQKKVRRGLTPTQKFTRQIVKSQLLYPGSKPNRYRIIIIFSNEILYLRSVSDCHSKELDLGFGIIFLIPKWSLWILKIATIPFDPWSLSLNVDNRKDYPSLMLLKLSKLVLETKFFITTFMTWRYLNYFLPVKSLWFFQFLVW